MAKATSNMNAIKKKLDRIFYALVCICLTLGGIIGVMFTIVTK